MRKVKCEMRNIKVWNAKFKVNYLVLSLLHRTVPGG